MVTNSWERSTSFDEKLAYLRGLRDALDIMMRAREDKTIEQWWSAYYDIKEQIQMAADRGYSVSFLGTRPNTNGDGQG